MVCRSKDKGELAKGEVISQSGNANIFLHILDMGDAEAVKAFATEFVKRSRPLNALVGPPRPADRRSTTRAA